MRAPDGRQPTTDRPTPDMTASPGSPPRRPPPGRVSPEALAAAREAFYRITLEQENGGQHDPEK
jgi:hypothetical protein